MNRIRVLTTLVLILLGLGPLFLAAQTPDVERLKDELRRAAEERINADKEKTLNPHLDAETRSRALSDLQFESFETARSVAPALLAEKDGYLGVRAAWILAKAHDERGYAALRSLAQQRTDDGFEAVRQLGRIRDAQSHELIRRMLESEPHLEAHREMGEEFGSDEPTITVIPTDNERIETLILALSDYFDPSDAELIARVMNGRVLEDWVTVEALGATGGPNAIPFLNKVLAKHRGHGWAAVGAELGLARCGSATARESVKVLLAEASLPDDRDPNVILPTNAETDDAEGIKAAHFILERLGVPADLPFVPSLLSIVDREEAPYRSRSAAWKALLLIQRRDPAVIKRALRNLKFESAARIVVLEDEPSARKLLEGKDPGNSSYEASVVRAALATPPWDRHLWAERQTYGFR